MQSPCIHITLTWHPSLCSILPHLFPIPDPFHIMHDCECDLYLFTSLTLLKTKPSSSPIRNTA